MARPDPTSDAPGVPRVSSAGATRDFGLLASSPGADAFRRARREDPAALRVLEARVAHDLACLNYPPADWVPPRAGPDGAPVLDVLVAGGGMCGQTAAYALRREGLHRVRTIDARGEGFEGPWATFARMEMLRSPKHLTGPDLGVPSLTFRAWYEARFGLEAWGALHKVWRLDWRDYLLWVRRQVGVAVDGGVGLVSVAPARGALALSVAGPGGKVHVVHARKLVLALGREGSGQPRRPGFPSLAADPAAARGRVFHSMDEIDFASLSGARIGVLGVGASAFDNAGLALEHGASSVTMFARRARLPQVNKSKWTSFTGFFRGYPALPDAERQRFYAHVFDEQVPPPFESVLRCDRHPGFALRLGEPWLDVAAEAQGVRVTTPSGEHRFDAVIFGTGFDVNLVDRPELGALAASVLAWGDRLAPDGSAVGAELSRFPYLGDGFQLIAKDGSDAAVAEALGRIHLFSWGSTLSHGAVAGDIPGLAIGATRLSGAIVRDLFVEDAERHHERLLAHDEQELRPTRWWGGDAGAGPAGTA
ncbi:MAG: NAD(P)/FAD-dependent oxidoreductase [Burkholderiales bacterium]|nr:NAD(P)/FAD-dependent oxidoreductase [Burkholderiales bacterium]